MARVALVSPYALSSFGGVQEQVLAMSRELGRRGYEVLIVAPDDADRVQYDTPARVERFGQVLSMPANGSRAPLTLSPGASRDARRAVGDFAPDLVHFHEPFAPLIGWGVLRAHAVPAVATFHRGGGGPALRYSRPLLRSLAAKLDACASVSEAAAATILEAAGVESEVLFNGFETERFVEPVRERQPETLVVTVGRLERRKGTRTAIRAVMAHNARGRTPWNLVIVGSGPERRELESLARADPRVTFTGSLPDAEKRAWLRRADVAVASATRGESFGLVVLEPMASEVMVVASDIPGYREAAGEHAVLFAAGDASALERALERAIAIESPERIAAAREHAERWSMRALMERYEALYDAARGRFRSARWTH
jgi:phosphatidyl-myo-inositol alpha-mannosyltransferase